MFCVQGVRSRPGPEAELVEVFINTSLPPHREGLSRCVFIEPQVGVARPDIVVVYWDPKIAESWPSTRRALDSFDLRLAHLLYIEGPCSEQQLKGAFPRGFSHSLEKLVRAQVICRDKGLWALKTLGDIFAVRCIMAFEAKISAISKALDQAYFNTWFASESYIVSPARNPSSETIDLARQRGIGIWSLPDESGSSPILDARERVIPQSYVSWLFDELVWELDRGRDI